MNTYRPPRKPNAPRPSAPRHAPSNVRIDSPDLLALVAYGDYATELSSFTGAYDAKFAKAVLGLPARVGTNGATNLTSGLRAANDLLQHAPRGLRRRIWLLTDGIHAPTIPRKGFLESLFSSSNVVPQELTHDALYAEAKRSYDLHVNVNTVGFGHGNQIDEPVLKAISGKTHNGKYFPAATAKRLGEIFRGSTGKLIDTKPRHAEATVFAIDVSPSMMDTLEGVPKIKLVVDTMLGLIRYKQELFS